MKSIYLRPSASHKWAPAPRSTISGSPPTDLNARTGLFTPPTSDSWARRNMSFVFELLFCSRGLGAIEASASLQPARQILRMVCEHNRSARALNRGENFEHHALLVNPAILRGGF